MRSRITSVQVTGQNGLRYSTGDVFGIVVTTGPEGAIDTNDYTLSSSNDTIISINNETRTGVALKAGSSTITALFNKAGVSNSARFTISDVLPTSVGITDPPGGSELIIGRSYPITPSVLPTNTTNKAVTYSGNNSSYLTLSKINNIDYINVLGKIATNTPITIRSVASTGIYSTVQYKTAYEYPTSIDISKINDSYNLTETIDLSTLINIIPSNTDNDNNYTITTQDTDKINIDGKKLTFIKDGSATITVTHNRNNISVNKLINIVYNDSIKPNIVFTTSNIIINNNEFDIKNNITKDLTLDEYLITGDLNGWRYNGNKKFSDSGDFQIKFNYPINMLEFESINDQFSSEFMYNLNNPDSKVDPPQYVDLDRGSDLINDRLFSILDTYTISSYYNKRRSTSGNESQSYIVSASPVINNISPAGEYFYKVYVKNDPNNYIIIRINIGIHGSKQSSNLIYNGYPTLISPVSISTDDNINYELKVQLYLRSKWLSGDKSPLLFNNELITHRLMLDSSYNNKININGIEYNNISDFIEIDNRIINRISRLGVNRVNTITNTVASIDSVVAAYPDRVSYFIKRNPTKNEEFSMDIRLVSIEDSNIKIPVTYTFTTINK
ncbi:hypothetical protein FPHOBKDP_00112 [Listeria phage LPJP1]|nr:hypothetical protein FPHOBKDP_00112 [Listeria phage LPJP1]